MSDDDQIAALLADLERGEWKLITTLMLNIEAMPERIAYLLEDIERAQSALLAGLDARGQPQFAEPPSVPELRIQPDANAR